MTRSNNNDNNPTKKKRSRSSGQVTLKDIAQRSGLSIYTVSTILNGKPDASLKTQERVIKIAKELNYRPNYFARRLKNVMANTIGLVLPFDSTIFTSESFNLMLQGLEPALSNHDYRIMLLCVGPQFERRDHYIQLFREKIFDGIIVFAPEPKDFEIMMQELGTLPLLLINSNEENHGINFIGVDNIQSIYTMTHYLIQHGHQDIAFINVPHSIADARERFKGFHKAMTEHALPINDLFIVETNWYCERPGFNEAAQLLRDPSKRPTAIICFDDIIAINAIKAAHHAGLNIPNDVSIVGFDDIPYATLVEPQLSTIRQPLEQMGHAAADKIIRIIEGKEPNMVRKTFHAELIVRESTGPAPA